MASFILNSILGLRRIPNVKGKVRALLALWRTLAPPDRPVVIDTVLHRPTAYHARLDLRCLHERMALFMDGYEMDTVRFLTRLFRPTGCFLDIGANIGLISVPFTLLVKKELGAAGQLPCPVTYCLEPVSSNYHTLRHNITINGCERWALPIRQAVGEREKNVEIQIEGNLRDETGTGTANILADGSDYPCERVPLHVTTIDTLVDSEVICPRVSLIKIDTDGYDLFALMGTVRLLESSRPLVFGEFMAHCMGWHGQSVGDVVEFVRPLNYRAFMRVERTWRFGRVVDPSRFVQDMLLVPEERMPEVTWCLE